MKDYIIFAADWTNIRQFHCLQISRIAVFMTTHYMLEITVNETHFVAILRNILHYVT